MKDSKNPLVSIVTPCFNGESKISTFLDSVLNQTYDHMEIFFIDDGSTDHTASICKQYMGKFQEKGIDFHYIYQENAGQAVALNQGLQLFSGKYLTWPDSDDYLMPEYVEKKVDFLEKHPELNMVISPICHVSDQDLEKILLIEKRNQTEPDNLFKDFINGTNTYFPPGGYMVTREGFLQAYPERKIYVSREGQNIQMLLPFAYMKKYGYIDDILYKYIIYGDSHAHQVRSYEDAVKRSDRTTELYDIVMKQLNMPREEYESYKKLLEHERWRRHFYFALQYRKRKDMNEAYKNYRKTGKVMRKIFLLHIVRQFKW